MTISMLYSVAVLCILSPRVHELLLSLIQQRGSWPVFEGGVIVMLFFKTFGSHSFPYRSLLLHTNVPNYPVHYPTRDLLRRLGLLKQGVTIFIIT